jgi:hypothetical protein
MDLGGAPHYSVEVLEQDGKNDQTFPLSSITKYSFPPRGALAAVDVFWYDGGKKPKRPEGVPEDQKMGDGDNGSLFIGDKGAVTAGEYGGNPRLLPDEKMADYTPPDPWLERIEGNHYTDWLQACKGGPAACSNFDYAGPFGEMVQFGNLAVKAGKKLEWDNRRGIVTNVPNASSIVSKEYRKGWELPI